MPAALDFQGPGSFAELIKRYSGDMAPIAMQQELVRLGLISVTKRQWLKLETSGFLATTNLDTLQILGTDTAELIDTIQHDVNCPKDQRRYQRKACYVNLPHCFVKPFRHCAAAERQQLLEKLNRWLAKHHDKETADSPVGCSVGIGINHFEKPSKIAESDKGETQHD